MLMIQNQLVGAPIGQNITLECISEAFPKSINYWMRSSRNDSIIVSGKYRSPTENGEWESFWTEYSGWLVTIDYTDD